MTAELISDYIDVAKQFTPRPYGRYRDDHKTRSAEVFREEILLPALRVHKHVVVDLSGSNWFGPSFLEETFGGLRRKHNDEFTYEQLKAQIEVRHKLLPSLVTQANYYLEHPEGT